MFEVSTTFKTMITEDFSPAVASFEIYITFDGNGNYEEVMDESYNAFNSDIEEDIIREVIIESDDYLAFEEDKKELIKEYLANSYKGTLYFEVYGEVFYLEIRHDTSYWHEREFAFDSGEYELYEFYVKFKELDG